MKKKRIEELKYLPLPISEKTLELARKLKELGLDWQPEVGHFVWDPLEVIESPSPFPMRVYFILSMKRFLSIFDSVVSMKSKLVWVPTLHQLRSLANQEKLTIEWERRQDPAEDWISLCTAVINSLQASPTDPKLEE